MFSSSQEFYKYIEMLISKLKDADEPEWASALSDAMGNGSTGSEVLGNIMLALKKFQASKVPRKLGMRGEIRAITMDLSRVLKRWA